MLADEVRDMVYVKLAWPPDAVSGLGNTILCKWFSLPNNETSTFFHHRATRAVSRSQPPRPVLPHTSAASIAQGRRQPCLARHTSALDGTVADVVRPGDMWLAAHHLQNLLDGGHQLYDSRSAVGGVRIPPLSRIHYLALAFAEQRPGREVLRYTEVLVGLSPLRE